MKNKNFKRLLEKYQAGQCTPEEEKLVEQWYESFENEEDGIQQLSETEKAALENKIRQRLQNRMHVLSGNRTIWLMPYVNISVAALLLIIFGYFFWNWKQQAKNENDYVTIESKQGIRKVILQTAAYFP